MAMNVRRLTVDGIEKAYGDRRILRGCNLKVDAGERVGLVGANGCGKSTFLRILAGDIHADHGQCTHTGRMAWLNQNPHLPGRTVGDAIEDALGWHHELTAAYAAALDGGAMEEAAVIQDRLDLVGWDLSHQADAILDRVGAPERAAAIDKLSGGERRRVALARALLAGADLLLLDEPTNHLDAQTIAWLESYLENFGGAVVLVTHDRYLLERVATRIVEIERGETVGYDGSYTDYLIARADRQEGLAQAEQRRMRFIAQEAAWAARSPAARTTKQKARLQRLDALQSQERWTSQREMALDMSTGDRFGGTLLDAQGLSKSFGDRTLIRDLSLSLSPRERLGIVGPNGAGKSTLLKLLRGAMNPDRGSIVRASRVKVGLLDQQRSGLRMEDTVFEAAGGGNDHVRLGDRHIHVSSFLGRFLFTREHHDQKVSSLSGGERARLLMARLLLQGANLLMLDEPTNDLDLMTLRVLEEALLSYDGGVVVVTHDRAFLDRVCTAVLAFEDSGRVVRYASRQQAEAAAAALQQAAAKPREKSPPRVAGGGTSKAAKRSYREQKELDAIPGKIEALEQEQEDINAQLADPALYQEKQVAKMSALSQRLSALEAELEQLYARWEALESLA